jgi:flavin-dependent dehydrogenase
MTSGYDVVIVGGGPAGTTVATLVKKYSPHLRVLLLEKEHFPRHHVGESLLAGATPVLRDMGVYDRITSYGFIEKSGATYIWGHERTPWGFDFDQALKPLIEQGATLPGFYAKGWQVRRAEYDDQLWQHAVEMGVEAHQGAQVREILSDASAEMIPRVHGIVYDDATGRHEVRCHWLIDSSGQAAVVGRTFNLHKYIPDMNNVALYAYWRNFIWYESFLGLPHFTRIFLATSPRGWFWCIPASAEVMSVGLVTRADWMKQAAQSPADFYFDEIQACPEVAAILAGASLMRLSPDQKRDVLAVRDWSYESRQLAGNGWALVGDAAGFVDPILSSGVMLAHELGQKAAYTLNAMFRAGSDPEIARYWQFYEQTYRTYLRAYREMAQFWYGSNFLMEDWWRAAHPKARADSAAFMRLASGYANRAESLSLFGSYPLHEARQLVAGLFGGDYDARQLAGQYTDRKLRLNDCARLEEGLYYFQGFVHKTRRIMNTATNQYLDLHLTEDRLLRSFDGQHTLDDLDRQVREIRATQRFMPIRDGLDLLVQLDEIGVLAAGD